MYVPLYHHTNLSMYHRTSYLVFVPLTSYKCTTLPTILCLYHNAILPVCNCTDYLMYIPVYHLTLLSCTTVSSYQCTTKHISNVYTPFNVPPHHLTILTMTNHTIFLMYQWSTIPSYCMLAVQSSTDAANSSETCHVLCWQELLEIFSTHFV